MERAYEVDVLPFHSRRVGDDWLTVSETGDYLFLTEDELSRIAANDVYSLPLDLQAKLKSRYFTVSKNRIGSARLMRSRQAARQETIDAGPSLHIIVPTLQCAHSCQYCQVSRSLSDVGHTMSNDDIERVCNSIFESSAQALTVEFQGGDPLLRFDLLESMVLRIKELNREHRKEIRFVIASTLHQLDEAMCTFFAEHNVYLSTSIDGPVNLHNKNRPIPGRDSYERTLNGISLAREILGNDSVSALMTTTKFSLDYPEEIVDEYVKLEFTDIFLRPLSSYGFAKRNQRLLGYSLEEFQSFYQKALARVLYWNKQGVELREVYASIILNKILSPFDGGYVDLQSPTGAGQSVLAYNYDGYIYPSDEARMLAETGDTSLRLGKIGQDLALIQKSPLQSKLIEASTVENVEGCQTCAYQTFCAPNPVDMQAEFGRMDHPVLMTEHCLRHQWLFDFFFNLIKNADEDTIDLFHYWAKPTVAEREDTCVV